MEQELKNLDLSEKLEFFDESTTKEQARSSTKPGSDTSLIVHSMCSKNFLFRQGVLHNLEVTLL